MPAQEYTSILKLFRQASILRFPRLLGDALKLRRAPSGAIEFAGSGVISWKSAIRSKRERHMHGLMQNMPLMITSLIRHADRNHGDTEIVSRETTGGIHR